MSEPLNYVKTKKSWLKLRGYRFISLGIKWMTRESQLGQPYKTVLLLNMQEIDENRLRD